MKKMLSVLICLILCLPTLPAALASGRDLSFEAGLAEQLQALDLFRGVGGPEDGSGGFALDRAPTRTEAVVMLVRALGKGAQAEGMAKTHPFSDVPPWADGYISYAYEQGLSRGASDTHFGAEEPASAEMYLTFLLRALGYSDRWDFSWDSPWALAAWCGILPPRVDWDSFLRADAVDLTAASLYATLKGGAVPLHQKLEQAGAFTAEQFTQVFPTDPFADYRAMDAAITQAVAERVTLGQVSGCRYRSENHIILDVTETADVLAVTGMVSYSNVDLNEDNTAGNWGYNGIGMELWLVELDPSSLALRTCYTQPELTAQGQTLEDIFPEDVLSKRDRAWAGFPYIDTLAVQKQLNLGTIGYRPSTHDEALVDIMDSFGYYEGQRMETDVCTVLQYYIRGTSRGTFAHLALVYKPGSVPGDGAVIALPIPGNWDWYQNSYGPKTLTLSRDRQTLTYTYHFDERQTTSYTEGSEIVVHEAGTYCYTVDLATGEATLEIVPD